MTLRATLEPLAKLKRLPRNPKMHDLGEIHTSISRFGFLERIIVNDVTGRLIAGHGRIDALQQKKAVGQGPPENVEERGGQWLVPADHVNIPESEEEAAAIALNRLGEAGGWDDALLAQVLSDLAAENERELEGLGFDADDLDELLAGLAPLETVADPGAQVDKAEELQEKWQVRTGDVWEVGSHRIVCGDCTDAAVVEAVMQGEMAGAVVTDPPYGMNLDTDWSGIRGTGKSLGFAKKIRGKVYAPVVGDDKPFDASFLFDLFTVDEMFLFGADYYSDTILNRNEGSWLVWDKRKESQAEGFGSEFELIWSKRRHKRRILRHEWFGFLREGEHGQARAHPTQKSVALIMDILQQWCGEIILDPFLGAGTTAVACEQLGRHCRGIEIEPKYVAVTLERLQGMGLEPRRVEEGT